MYFKFTLLQDEKKGREEKAAIRSNFEINEWQKLGSWDDNPRKLLY